MKRLLRKVLSKAQYEILAELKNRGRLNERLVLLCDRVFLSLIKRLIKGLLDKSRITLKADINIVKRMDYERCDIFLIVDSEIECTARLHSCKKEPHTIRWIETFLREGDVLYDVGANVGTYSLVAAKYFGGKVLVYAFEPAFLNFTQLCKNLVLNGCHASVVPLQIALSDKTQIENFNYNNLIPGGALHSLGEAIDYKGDAFEPVLKQAVLSYRIDDFVEQFKIPVANHIKLDVDGIELSILRGAELTLGNPSVRSILVEIEEGGEEASRTIGFLSQKGFEVNSKEKYPYGDESGPSSNMFNYVFVRRFE